MDGTTKFALWSALGIYILWVTATYLLEGLPGTFHRPEASELRLTYALVANLAVGIILPLCVVHRLVAAGWASQADLGIVGFGRRMASIGAAIAIGTLFFLSQAEAMPLVALLNVFAQAWVVSVAEIVVCWMLIGAIVFISLSGWNCAGGYAIAAGLASALFGAYHFAHSPPFNQIGMVAFLAAIGLITSLWWFLSRDVYGTAILHNFFAMIGITEASKARVNFAEEPSVALLSTAALVTAVLVLWMVRIRKTLISRN